MPIHVVNIYGVNVYGVNVLLMNDSMEYAEMPAADLPENAWRDYKVLHAIDEDENLSQDRLAKKVGIAVGLANKIIKRLVRKGMVKTQRINAKRIAYYLTPQGFSEKFRLVMQYTQRTISFFSAVREITRAHLCAIKSEQKIRRVALIGTGEIAEVVYLTVQELGLELVGVYELERAGVWLGQPAPMLTESAAAIADVAVVADLEPAAEKLALVEKLAPVVVEMRRLLGEGLAEFAQRFEY